MTRAARPRSVGADGVRGSSLHDLAHTLSPRGDSLKSVARVDEAITSVPAIVSRNLRNMSNVFRNISENVMIDFREGVISQSRT